MSASAGSTKGDPSYRLENGTLVVVSPGATEPAPISKDRVKMPKLTHSADPKWPGKDRTGGICVLKLTVGLDGKPHDIAVVQSLRPDYDEKSIEAVKNSVSVRALLTESRYQSKSVSR